MDEDDHSLLKRLAQRENQAWEDFCRQHSGPLLAVIRLRFGCSQELAEEVVQLAFIRCVRSIHTFDSRRGRLFDWLKAIASNEARTLLRKTIRREQVELEPQDQEWIQQIDQAELPSERLCRQEVQSLILETVMRLKERYRRALLMKYVENKPVSEMARTLGESEKAVESLLTRSRVAFKELITRHCNYRPGRELV